MKILLILLLVIAVLIAALLMVALFIKKEYTLAREIIINKPRKVVFDYVKYLKNQDYYSKWVMMDPLKKTEFRGTDGTIGFVYAWDSKNKSAGKGEQEIKNITEDERVDIEVRFEKPFEGIATTPFLLQSTSDNQTKITWSMNGKSKYPMNLMNPFMDNLLGKDLQASLNTLKNILEN